MKHPKSYDTNPDVQKRMACVHLKHSATEVAIAKALWHKGFRYRLNYRKLPGSPDIAILRYKIAVFVDGEFWHGYHWTERREKLKSNREYWIEKIEENKARDIKNDRKLVDIGWTPIHFWENEVKKDLQGCLCTIDSIIVQNRIEALPEEPIKLQV